MWDLVTWIVDVVEFQNHGKSHPMLNYQVEKRWMFAHSISVIRIGNPSLNIQLTIAQLRFSIQFRRAGHTLTVIINKDETDSCCSHDSLRVTWSLILRDEPVTNGTEPSTTADQETGIVVFQPEGRGFESSQSRSTLHLANIS